MTTCLFKEGDVVNIGSERGKIIRVDKPLGTYEIYVVQTYNGEFHRVAKHQIVKALPDDDFISLGQQNSHSNTSNSTQMNLPVATSTVPPPVVAASSSRPQNEFMLTECCNESDEELLDICRNIDEESMQHADRQLPMVTQNTVQSESMPSVPLPTSRFQNVTMDQVDDFINIHENANTKRKTVSHVNLLTEFLQSKGQTREIHEIGPDELDPLLSQFFVSVRQNNGAEYEPSTLRNMLSSFERYLKQRNYPESLVNSVKFAKCRTALKSKQKNLKMQGHGNKPKTADRVTDTEINELFECQELGMSTPNSILNTLWFYNTLLFGMRGGAQEHRSLKWGGVKLGYDQTAGKEYLEYNERQTKTRTGEDCSLFRTKPRMYENKEDTSRCPKKFINVNKITEYTGNEVFD